MSDQQQRINQLMEQYVSKNISAEDFAELFELIGKAENKDFIENFMKQNDKSDIPPVGVHQIDWTTMYDRIVSNKKENQTLGKVIRIGQRLLVAASLLLVAYVGFQFYQQGHIEPVSTAVKQDLNPGGNKAILKLADGSQIILNDVKNGILAHQGTAEINKSKEGFIQYQPAGGSEPGKILTNTLTTPKGGLYRLMLPDRTLVWLNAESSITFPTAFSGDKRQVSITGEVYFEVAKDKSKPFTVTHDQTNIKVLGTHFNACFYPDEAHSVTLLEGAVEVKNQNHKKLMIPGQQALLNDNTGQIRLQEADTDQVVDWKNGLFIFEDASVQEVMRQVARWYDVDVTYSGRIPAIKFNGVVSRNNPVSKLLKMLQQAGNVQFHIEDKIIQVKSNNK